MRNWRAGVGGEVGGEGDNALNAAEGGEAQGVGPNLGLRGPVADRIVDDARRLGESDVGGSAADRTGCPHAPRQGNGRAEASRSQALRFVHLAYGQAAPV